MSFNVLSGRPHGIKAGDLLLTPIGNFAYKYHLRRKGNHVQLE
jgi:hypothetical protein